MHPFTHRRVGYVEQAVDTRPADNAEFIAGGTNLIDLMKLDVMNPDMLVDINGLTAGLYNQIQATSTSLRLGALVRMADAQDHPAIKTNYPVIAETLQLAASQQIRTMASLGGNVLQRTRCAYFRDGSSPCNKRHPGSGCAAIGGVNRQHAILGTSDQCIATYPGDFAQALIALDAHLEIRDGAGTRRLPFAALHRPPQKTPHIETALHKGDLITLIEVTNAPWMRRSHYLKVRDRDSFAFAQASAAIALDLDGDVVRQARIALGGVATIPWRSDTAEAVLVGQRLDERSAAVAADAAFAEARGYGANDYKIPLGKQTLIRALLETKAMKV